MRRTQIALAYGVVVHVLYVRIETANGGLPSKRALPRLPAATYNKPHMSLCYAVLVDGGFVKRKLGNAAHPMTSEVLGKFVDTLAAHPSLSSLRLHRIYFYDAAPLTQSVQKPLGGPSVDYALEPTAVRNQALHQQIPKLDNMALRMGELAHNGWRLRPSRLKYEAQKIEIGHEDLLPAIQQKGVDMRIGLDIAALTLKKIAQVIVLVTGDSDFVPAMKFARREGARLYLVTMGHGVKPQLLEHADLVLDVAYERPKPAEKKAVAAPAVAALPAPA